ncbi:MAG: LysR substrate-binding domain-containing protein [Burkholderiaceae bacterium]
MSNALDHVTDGDCDILCSREPMVLPEDWSFHACLDDSLVVICGAANPLAGRTKVPLAELGKQRWLLTRTGSVARRRFEAIAEQGHWPIELRSGVITHTPTLTLQMITAGGYVTLIPRSVALPWMQAGQVVELPCEASLTLPRLGILLRERSANRATMMFAAELVAHFADSSEAAGENIASVPGAL